MKICVSLLFVALSVFAAATAYDFQDSAYNAFLFDELQSANDDASDALTPRSRRDAATDATAAKECARRDWKKDFLCCKGDKFDREHLEAFKDVKKQCITELRGNNDDVVDPFNCDKMQQVKEQMVCVCECVAKKFNMIDEKGDIKRDVLLEELRSKAGDVQWKKDALEGYVDKCLAEVKQEKAEHEKAGAEATKGCNPYPLSFHRCIWREFWNGCPAELRVDTPKCNKIRESIGSGDPAYFSKHFLHKFFHSKRDEE